MTPLVPTYITKTKLPSDTNRKAFSLVELLAVIGIIGILLALTFPAAQAVRQAARRTACLSNIRQVMTATLSYETSGNGFPTADNGKGASLLVPLLPYMEQPELEERAKIGLVAGETYNDKWGSMANTQISILICPATGPTENLAELNSQGTYTTHYFGVAGPAGFAVDKNGQSFNYKELKPTPAEGPIAFQGLFGLSPNGKFRPRQFKDILDGASNTLAYGEIAGTPPRTSTRSMNRSGWAFGAKYSSSGKVTEIYGCKTVTKGINEPVGKINDVPFASNHPSGAQFAMADGSTHFIDASIDLDILKILSSMDGREATTPLF